MGPLDRDEIETEPRGSVSIVFGHRTFAASANQQGNFTLGRSGREFLKEFACGTTVISFELFGEFPGDTDLTVEIEL